MIAVSLHTGKVKFIPSKKAARLLILRLTTFSASFLSMASEASRPLGAIKLKPLNMPSAFGSHETGEGCSDTPKETSTASQSDNTDLQSQALEADSEKNLILHDTGNVNLKGVKTHKVTVLPQRLLNEVTSLVKQQAVIVPRLDSDQSGKPCLSEERKCSSMNVDRTDAKIDDSGVVLDNLSECASDVGMIALSDADCDLSDTINNRTPLDDHHRTEAKASAGIEPISKPYCSEPNLSQAKDMQYTHPDEEESYLDPFVGLDLDVIEREKQVAVDAVDVIPDLAALFSGELEKRRKRELKKAKQKSWKQKKRKKEKPDELSALEESRPKKPAKPTVNYFVGIQISNPKIQAALRLVQESVVAACKELKPALNKPATLHMTLFVLSINSEEEMIRSKLALDAAEKRLQSLYTDSQLSLDILGLGHFRHEIVFAKVPVESQIAQLQEIAQILEDCFLDQTIVSPDSKGFKPHITIMKLSFLKGRKGKGIKKIDEKLYEDYVDSEFGNQQVDTIQLCSIHKKKDDSGYYQVEHKVQFASGVHGDETEGLKKVTDETPSGKYEIKVKKSGETCQLDNQEMLKSGDVAGLTWGNVVDRESCVGPEVTNVEAGHLGGNDPCQHVNSVSDIKKSVGTNTSEIASVHKCYTETKQMEDEVKPESDKEGETLESETKQ